MATKIDIRSNAFYGNSLSLKREESEGTAIAQGHYITRYGTVHLYGQNYGPARKPIFSFDFTYEGRNYMCTFREWLSDATVRFRAIRFVEACVEMAKTTSAPTPNIPS